MKPPRLHVVTDDTVLAATGFETLAVRVMQAGAGRLALHVRGHATSAARLHALARRLREAAGSTNSLLFVNDRLDIALAVSAHGVQVGRRSVPVERARSFLPVIMLGYSAHDADEACRAEQAGADFVLLGAVYATATHPGAAPSGPGLIELAAARVTLPVIAIGGVSPGRAREVRQAGAAGVATQSGVWGAPDPVASVLAYGDALAEL